MASFTQSASSSMTMAGDTQTTVPADLDASKLNLPSPDLFDILPALHEILARIDRAPSADVADASHSNNSGTNSPGGIDANYQDQLPLDPKELPTEVLAIKSKIRRALRELEKLPDMDLTIEQQEEDIAELEARIAKQKAMMAKLGDMASKMGGSSAVG